MSSSPENALAASQGTGWSLAREGSACGKRGVSCGPGTADTGLRRAQAFRFRREVRISKTNLTDSPRGK